MMGKGLVSEFRGESLCLLRQGRIQDFLKGGSISSYAYIVLHAHSRGVWGHAPQEIFENYTL